MTNQQRIADLEEKVDFALKSIRTLAYWLIVFIVAYVVALACLLWLWWSSVS